jgi:hypothetical protein
MKTNRDASHSTELALERADQTNFKVCAGSAVYR